MQKKKAEIQRTNSGRDLQVYEYFYLAMQAKHMTKCRIFSITLDNAPTSKIRK